MTRSVGRRGNRRAWLAAGCVVGTAACTQLASPLDTAELALQPPPDTGEELPGDPGSPPPESIALEKNWQCLDETREFPGPEEDELPTSTETRRLLPVNFVGTPLRNVTLKSCEVLSDCSGTSQLGTGSLVANSPVYEIEVPVNVNNFYLLFEAPGYVPSTTYMQRSSLTRMQGAEGGLPPPQILLREDRMTNFLNFLGVSVAPPDSEPGNRLVDQVVFGGAIFDCNGAAARGAKLVIINSDSQPGARHWAFREGASQPSLGEDVLTGERGLAGFIGLAEDGDRGVGLDICGEYKGRRFGFSQVRLRSGQLATSQVRATLPCQ